MLRTRLRRACFAAVLLLATGVGTAHAFLLPTAAGPVHGTCTFSSLSVHAGGGTFSVNGSGTCVANGTVTTGNLGIAGPLSVDVCGAKVGSGTASLALGGPFPQLNGSAMVTVHGTTSSAVFLGGLSGTGVFADLLRGVCLTDTAWTGSIAF